MKKSLKLKVERESCHLLDQNHHFMAFQEYDEDEDIFFHLSKLLETDIHSEEDLDEVLPGNTRQIFGRSQVLAPSCAGWNLLIQRKIDSTMVRSQKYYEIGTLK